MAEITAAAVKQLREDTGAGMMDCKKALVAAEGDMDAAVEILRKNGQAKAEKKAGRIAAEGISYAINKDDKTAAIVEVNSETDFAAKTDKFQDYVKEVADQAAESASKDIDAFMAEKWNKDTSKTVKEALTDKIAVIGENLSIRRFEKITEADGCAVTYVHGGGRIAVVIGAETAVVNDAIKEALVNVAMRVAAMNPKYISKNDIEASYIEHEKEIFRAQIMNDPQESKKPEKVIDGIVMGRVNKECKEVCLLDQVYVKAEDGKQSVEKYLEQISKENGTSITIKQMVRFETGVGIEKKQEDFAAEVAAQMQQ